jgi:regulator of sirC expression with transglutaminase-like and TPR domain
MNTLREDFQAAIAGRDEDVDLFAAALVIARLDDEQPDVAEAAHTLDLLADDIRYTLSPDATLAETVEAINVHLFEVEGFHGNSRSYYEPQNSYLHQVLRRKTGIPITLSLVYMEVARRLGIRCDGIGFPSHFLVRCGEPPAAIYVDPFHGGIQVDPQRLLETLEGAKDGPSPESYLAAVTRRQLLQRMLNNLHGVFRDATDIPRWLSTVDLLLCIEPWNARLVGERGMLSYRAGDLEQALDDLERYVSAAQGKNVPGGALRILEQLRTRNQNEEQA